MPSLNDPGIFKVLPNFKLPDYLLSGLKGKLKKVISATNPMRISFRGKEIVFSRYDYFKKIKKCHLAKF
jgi:hypothetical protein